MTVSGGNGSQANHAPLGQTRTGVPLIVSRTAALDTEPNRKLESWTRTRSVAAGYTTFRAIGSRRAGNCESVGVGGTGSAADSRYELSMGWRAGREHPAAVSRITQAAGHRMRSIDARYIVAMTYAKATLTLPAGLPRFVKPSKPEYSVSRERV